MESNNSQKIVNELISISKKLSNPDKEKKVSETLILILDDNIKVHFYLNILSNQKNSS